MNLLAELDQLNLEPAAKTQVAAMLQALVEQAAQDAQTIANQQQLLQTKDASLQAKEVKIAALTHELAYYKRIRFSTKSEALACKTACKTFQGPGEKSVEKFPPQVVQCPVFCRRILECVNQRRIFTSQQR
jgi:hypothetical protein